jgi:hypothetical protein
MTIIVSAWVAVQAFLKSTALRKPQAPFLTAFLWLWMWVLIWGNLSNPDLLAYKYLYTSEQTTPGIGAGYWVLVNTAHQFSLSYEAFLAATSAAALIAMATVCNWYTNATSFPAVLYFTYPFVFDAIQARNLIAMSIVTLAFGLRARLEKGGTAALTCLILLASTVHITCLTYLLAIPTIYKSSRQMTRFVAIAAASLAVLIPIAPGVVTSVRPFLDHMLGESRYNSYFSTRMDWGVVLFATLHLLSLITLARCVRAISGTSPKAEGNPRASKTAPRPHLQSARHTADKSWSSRSQDRLGTSRLAVRSRSQPAIRSSRRPEQVFSEMVYGTSLLMTTALPFVMINSNFWRLFRNLWLLYAIVFSIAIYQAARGRERNKLLIWVLCLTLLHLVMLGLLDYESAIFPILENSRLTGILSL